MMALAIVSEAHATVQRETHQKMLQHMRHLDLQIEAAQGSEADVLVQTHADLCVRFAKKKPETRKDATAILRYIRNEGFIADPNAARLLKDVIRVLEGRP
jgi:hypothetical protein